MKFKPTAFALFAFATGFLLLFFFGQTKNFSHGACNEGAVTPVFSPIDSEQIFGLISDAKYEIKIEVYEFSYTRLATALIEAQEHGVSVKVILEHSVYQNNNMFNYLLNNGIEVSWASKKFHNTHSKFMIIDGNIVFVGSMNWSENALKFNREASVIVYSKEIASDFEKIFDMDFVI
jgi:phosphatidylserine/phosphatidylglycerophosphate/cardiolipin synthase-like enzyme